MHLVLLFQKLVKLKNHLVPNLMRCLYGKKFQMHLIIFYLLIISELATEEVFVHTTALMKIILFHL